MNILVANDDGIKAPGIIALVASLSAVADIYVCAPEGQRSAKSHSITLGEHVLVREVSFPNAVKAYETTGTPADCVKIGLQFFQEQGVHIDMVYTGTNMGSNLGKDTLYSGTVGAAMEAAVSGYQAVAVSVDSHEATNFDTAGKLAVDVMSLVYGKIETTTIININVPDLPKEEIKGVKCLPLGEKYYDDKFRLVENNRYELSGNPADFTKTAGEYDVIAAANGYAVITPLQFDYTDYKNLEKVKEWDLTI